MELRELQRQCVEDSAKYFPDYATFISTEYLLVALAGEVGELCNDYKKFARGDYLMPINGLAAQELPDILIYLLLIAENYQIDLQTAYDAKREFNNGRFGDNSQA